MPHADPSRLPAAYGTTAVVVGASSGIGAEFARQLADAGLDLVLVARRSELLQSLAESITARTPVSVEVLTLDLGTPGAVDQLNERTAALDVGMIVVSAATMTGGEFLTNDLETEVTNAELNVIVPLRLAHVFGNRFTARGRGAIVLISSMSADMAFPYAANYAASKAFVASMGRALHHEMAEAGVDVLTVLPGVTRTPALTDYGIDFTALAMPIMEPAPVVRAALEAVGRRSEVVPGAVNKAAALVTRLMPRSVLTRINGERLGKART